MRSLFIFFLSYFVILSTDAVDLTCPKSVITINTPTGSFPTGGSSMFPANYACAIEFHIPSGRVVLFNITNNLLFNAVDSFVIQDSALKNYSMFIIDSVFYAPASIAKVFLTTQTNTSSFHFTWQYTDVTNFGQIQYTTGSIVALNLTQNTYYRFNSPKSQVAFHTGSIIGDNDQSRYRIYVYDGENLNTKFLGNLVVFTDNSLVSTGRSLTLVNYYATATRCYGISNDYSAISGYSDYSFNVLSTTTPVFAQATTPSGKEFGMTVYCWDCQESYINSIRFLNPNVTGQEVRFKPMGPSDGDYNNLLTYNVRDPVDPRLPQQIPSNIYTIGFYQCSVYLGIFTNPFNWKNVAVGRTGSIISPSLWNPKTQLTAPFFTNLTATSNVKFVFDLNSVVIGKAGEKIRIEVGSPGTSPIGVEFSQTASNTGTKVAHGSYMATSFSGITLASSFSMTFSVETNIETTTKSSPSILNIPLLLVIVFVISS